MEKRNTEFWGRISWTVTVLIIRKEMEIEIGVYLKETGCMNGRWKGLPQNGP
jgi:hypothetical protein